MMRSGLSVGTVRRQA